MPSPRSRGRTLVKFGTPSRSRPVTSATRVTPIASSSGSTRSSVRDGGTERTTPPEVYFDAGLSSQSAATARRVGADGRRLPLLPPEAGRDVCVLRLVSTPVVPPWCPGPSGARSYHGAGRQTMHVAGNDQPSWMHARRRRLSYEGGRHLGPRPAMWMS